MLAVWRDPRGETNYLAERRKGREREEERDIWLRVLTLSFIEESFVSFAYVARPFPFPGFLVLTLCSSVRGARGQER